MTKQQENRAFVKMLKEFPKAFGRVSFRERLMLKVAFNYVVEEIIVDLEKENSDLKERYNRVDIIGYDALKNLTKAREIIKRLKSLIEDVCDINYLSKNNTKLLEETEQFLNSEVEK